MLPWSPLFLPPHSYWDMIINRRTSRYQNGIRTPAQASACLPLREAPWFPFEPHTYPQEHKQESERRWNRKMAVIGVILALLSVLAAYTEPLLERAWQVILSLVIDKWLWYREPWYDSLYCQYRFLTFSYLNILCKNTAKLGKIIEKNREFQRKSENFTPQHHDFML